MQFRICCGAVLGQGGSIHGVAVSLWILGLVFRASCPEPVVRRATGFKPHRTRKDI